MIFDCVCFHVPKWLYFEVYCMVGAYCSIKIMATLDINKIHVGYTGISASILGFESVCCFQNCCIYTKGKEKYFF